MRVAFLALSRCVGDGLLHCLSDGLPHCSGGGLPHCSGGGLPYCSGEGLSYYSSEGLSYYSSEGLSSHCSSDNLSSHRSSDNLSSPNLDNPLPHSTPLTIIDPFCGSGTLLQEFASYVKGDDPVSQRRRLIRGSSELSSCVAFSTLVSPRFPCLRTNRSHALLTLGLLSRIARCGDST